MNIAFISPCDLSVENGGQTHTLELAQNWAELGHNVWLFSSGFNRNNLDISFQYVNVPRSRKNYYLGKLQFSLITSMLLPLYHLRFKFDAVFYRTSVFDFPILFAKLFGLNTIAELNDVPYSETYEKLMHCENRLFKKTILMIGKRILKPLERITLGNATGFVTTTHKIESIELYSDIRNRSHFVSFGANTRIFYPLDIKKCRSNLKLSTKERVVCFVGSFHRWHGLEDLIMGMRIVCNEIPYTRLLIIGDDDYLNNKLCLRNKLQKQISDLGLTENIKLVGRVPYDKVPIYVNASDVCVVMQKKARSGFSPLKMFEYLACGKPVVATDINGISEIISDCEAGILVKPGNYVNAAEAIIKLLTDHKLNKRMGTNGVNCIRNYYNWQVIAKHTLYILQKYSK